MLFVVRGRVLLIFLKKHVSVIVTLYFNICNFVNVILHFIIISLHVKTASIF